MPSVRKGFTLVELLVVITIIAVLSMIGMTIFSGVQKNARDAKRRADLDAIHTALELYKVANGHYPSTSDQWVCSSAAQPWITDASTPSIPFDTKYFATFSALLFERILL